MSLARPVLEIRDVVVEFGNLCALQLGKLDVPPQAGVAALIMGPNGAGKSTLLNLVSGYVGARNGATARLHCPRNDGVDLLRLSKASAVRAGLARTFQIPPVVESITIRESIVLAAHASESAVKCISLRKRNERFRELAEILIERLELTEVADACRRDFPLSVLRRAELGRCVATQPRLLLLDEPSAGSDADDVGFLVGLLTRGLPELVDSLHRHGAYRFPVLSIGVITHDLYMAHQLSRSTKNEPLVHFIHRGVCVVSGPLRQVLADQQVNDVYLGVRTTDS